MCICIRVDMSICSFTLGLWVPFRVAWGDLVVFSSVPGCPNMVHVCMCVCMLVARYVCVCTSCMHVCIYRYIYIYNVHVCVSLQNHCRSHFHSNIITRSLARSLSLSLVLCFLACRVWSTVCRAEFVVVSSGVAEGPSTRLGPFG